MRLTKVIIHNFRNYQATHTFEFSQKKKNKDKNIILIHADNNVGKTSFLDAILFCFYGIDSTGSSVDYKKNMNLEASLGGKTHFYTEIEFVYDENDGNEERKQFRIKRTLYENESDFNIWKINEGNNDPVLDKNNTINEILPKSMAKYFFFGGETTKMYLEKNSEDQIFEAVKNILGANIMERAKETLDEAVKFYRNKKVKSVSDKEYQIKQNIIEELAREIESKRNDIKKFESEIEFSKEQIEKCRDKLKKYDNVKSLFDEKERLEKSQEMNKQRNKENANQLLKWLSEKSVNLILKPVLEKLGDVSDELQEQKNKLAPPYNHNLLDMIEKEMNCICDRKVDKEIFEIIQKKIMGNSQEKEEQLEEAKQRIMGRITHAPKHAEDAEKALTDLYTNLDSITKEQKNITKQIKENKTNLEGATKDDKEKKKVQDNYDKHEAIIEQKNREIGKCKGDIETNTKKIKENKEYCDDFDKNKIINKDVEEMVDIVKLSSENIEKIIKNEADDARKAIQCEMNEIFKKNTMQPVNVKIKDNYSLDVSIEGQKKDLGEGYKMFIGMIFVLSLIKFNKIRSSGTDEKKIPGKVAPLILDAPTSKLGDILTPALCELIPPNVGQAILLLNTKETVNSDVRKKLKKYIDSEYLLVSHHKSASVSGTEDKQYVTIDNNRHQRYFYNQEHTTTKNKRIDGT